MNVIVREPVWDAERSGFHQGQRQPKAEPHKQAEYTTANFTRQTSNYLLHQRGRPYTEPLLRSARIETHAGSVFSIRDFGIGIPTHETQRLFTRFFRASTAKGLPGTGIGLNLVKELVELHGGAVTVASRVGEGTTFEVSLRVKLERALNPAAA